MSVWMILSAFWYVFGLGFIFSYYEMLKPLAKPEHIKKITFDAYRIVLSNFAVDVLIMLFYYVVIRDSFSYGVMSLMLFKGTLMVAVFWRRVRFAWIANKIRKRG